jgi:hypothetical protein
MIIPIRCFTCGKVLADKRQAYVKRVDAEQMRAQDAERARGGGRSNTSTIHEECARCDAESSANVTESGAFRGKIMDDLVSLGSVADGTCLAT